MEGRILFFFSLLLISTKADRRLVQGTFPAEAIQVLSPPGHNLEGAGAYTVSVVMQ